MSWKEKIPQPNDIAYFDFPQEASHSDYLKASIEVVEFINNLSNNPSIYQFGGINVPGISDLDLVIVLNEADQKNELKKWESLQPSLSPVTQYILTHEPLIINQKMWPGLPLMFPTNALKHLSGPILTPHTLAEDSLAIAHLFFEIEKAISAPYKNILGNLLKRKVSIRKSLARMNKVKYQAGVLAEFGVEDPRWSECASAVTRLRSNCVLLDKDQQCNAIYPLMITCTEIFSEMIPQLSRIMVRTGMKTLEIEEAEKSITGIFDYMSVFIKNYDPELGLEKYVKAYQITGKSISILPSTFILPFLIYASRAPNLNDYFRDRITLFCQMPDFNLWPLQKQIIDRIKVLDQYIQFIEEQNYGWLYFPKRKSEPSGSFWQNCMRHIKYIEDVFQLIRIKQMKYSQVQLEYIVKSRFWKWPSFFPNSVN